MGDDTTAALFTVGLDGTDLIRITHHPGAELAPTVLADGRVLYLSRIDQLGGTSDRLMVVRYDGTASQLYYQPAPGQRIVGRARETADGRVAFVEVAERGGGATLVTILQRRPLHSRVPLGDALEGTIAAAYPTTDGGFLLAYRPPESEHSRVHELRPGDGALAPLVDGVDGDVEDLVRVARGPRPKVFVSVVDEASEVGTLFGLDARLSDAPRAAPPTTLQVWGASGLLGETPLAEDGSFHIELTANTPVRLQTLDRGGRVVRGPSDWIWVRPNEKRGCIGCHEDRELAPSNRVPLAIERPAVRIPAAGQADGGS